jgi:hypothetical protein
MEMFGPWSNVFVSAKNGEEAEQEEQENWKKGNHGKVQLKSKSNARKSMSE